MNCNCAKDIADKIKDKFASSYKKPIEDVYCQGKNLSLTDGTVVYVATFNVELEGQKKIETVSVKQSFCPFCGGE